MTKPVRYMKPGEHERILANRRRRYKLKKLSKPMPWRWKLFGDRAFKEYCKAFPPPSEPNTGDE